MWENQVKWFLCSLTPHPITVLFYSPWVRQLPSFDASPFPQHCSGWVWSPWPLEESSPLPFSKGPPRWSPASVSRKPVRTYRLYQAVISEFWTGKVIAHCSIAISYFTSSFSFYQQSPLSSPASCIVLPERVLGSLALHTSHSMKKQT